MASFPFLSDEWIAAVHELREEYAARLPDGLPEAAPSIRMNLVITAVPFGDGVVHVHVDTSGGRLIVDQGHVDGPDLKVTTEYDTARSIIIDQDLAAAMQAFMGGRIRIEGDMAKFLSVQAQVAKGEPDPVAREIGDRVKALTQ